MSPSQPSNQDNTWALSQLLRMTRFFPERVEDALGRLLESDPSLRNELVIGAVDQEMLNIEQAAEFTGMEPGEIVQRLLEFRNDMARREVRIEKPNDRSVARISGAGVAVWEVEREYRKHSNVEDIHRSFPALTRNEVSQALIYAREHSDEIEREIARYEEVVQRRRNEYPSLK